MAFGTRLRALQGLTILGLVAIGAGLLVLPFPSGPAGSIAVRWLLGLGFVAAIACSVTLSRLRCPRCLKTFCGPKYDENERSTLFTSRCLGCGFRPGGL